MKNIIKKVLIVLLVVGMIATMVIIPALSAR